jgi:hypothetical protein
VQAPEQPAQAALVARARLPAAGRRDRHHGSRSAADRKLERDPATKRVSDQMRLVEAGVIEVSLDRVHQRRDRSGAGAQLAAADMPGEADREQVERSFELGQDRVPQVPRAREAMDQDHRLAVAAAKHGLHAPRSHRHSLSAAPRASVSGGARRAPGAGAATRGSGTGLENEVERRLRDPAEAGEAACLNDVPNPCFAGLRPERQPDLL